MSQVAGIKDDLLQFRITIEADILSSHKIPSITPTPSSTNSIQTNRIQNKEK